VVVAGEEEQQRVAAELQEAATGLVRDLEQGLEAGPDGVGDLLGADLAVPGQALGHLGEAGDVDEEERAVDGLGQVIGRGGRPVQGQPGDVGQQRLVRGLTATACDRTCPHLVAPTRNSPTAGKSLPAGNGTSVTFRLTLSTRS
jgi:hypothetical protein